MCKDTHRHIDTLTNICYSYMNNTQLQTHTNTCPHKNILICISCTVSPLPCEDTWPFSDLLTSRGHQSAACPLSSVSRVLGLSKSTGFAVMWIWVWISWGWGTLVRLFCSLEPDSSPGSRGWWMSCLLPSGRAALGDELRACPSHSPAVRMSWEHAHHTCQLSQGECGDPLVILPGYVTVRSSPWP